ncbi:hypothetical protein [Rubritalea tangerina]
MGEERVEYLFQENRDCQLSGYFAWVAARFINRNWSFFSIAGLLEMGLVL